MAVPSPLPTAQPAPKKPERSGCGCGCLILVILLIAGLANSDKIKRWWKENVSKKPPPRSVTPPTRPPVTRPPTRVIEPKTREPLSPQDAANARRQSATGRITGVELGHGTVQNGERGLTITAGFQVTGLAGLRGRVAAFVLYDDGRPVEATVPAFQTPGRQLTVQGDYTPLYDTSNFTNYSVFLPYRAFAAAGGSRAMKIRLELLTGAAAQGEVSRVLDWSMTDTFTWTAQPPPGAP